MIGSSDPLRSIDMILAQNMFGAIANFIIPETTKKHRSRSTLPYQAGIEEEWAASARASETNPDRRGWPFQIGGPRIQSTESCAKGSDSPAGLENCCCCLIFWMFFVSQVGPPPSQEVRKRAQTRIRRVAWKNWGGDVCANPADDGRWKDIWWYDDAVEEQNFIDFSWFFFREMYSNWPFRTLHSPFTCANVPWSKDRFKTQIEDMFMFIIFFSAYCLWFSMMWRRTFCFEDL